MRDLLAVGGFRVRTAIRADCAHCVGRSRGTVSYNAEVAHCFRCGWKANRLTLARELGLARKARTGSRANARVRREVQHRAKNEGGIRAFTQWRDERLRQVSGRHYALSRAALRAEQALASGALTPEEQELAWSAMGRFRHEEARLSAAFDVLTCAKASAWLECDSRIEELFEYWKAGGSSFQPRTSSF